MYKARMKTKRTNPDFLNGVPELLILSLLARRSMYGYELVQAIRQSTNGTLEFGEGCVYPILHRLEAEGLLASKRETVAGRSRVIYRVTAKGSKQLSSTATTWQQIVQAINHALQGGEYGQPALD
jgi:PadR family transcriptional regulator PadR